MQEREALRDVKRNGKIRNWRRRKSMSVLLAESYERQGMVNRYIRVVQCGCFLEFAVDERTGRYKLKKAELCKNRLCALCSAMRSEKVFWQVSKVMDYAQENHDYRYIFLTLTVRNVKGSELSKMLDKLFAGFNRMTRRKEFKNVSIGYFRCLEVTHNWLRGDDYHPHIHIVIAVDPTYFSRHDCYMSHDQWMKLFRDCMDLDYDPWVDVRTVKPNGGLKEKGEINYGKAVKEVAKYTAKPSDYIVTPGRRLDRDDRIDMKIKAMCENETDKAVAVLDGALLGRRLMSYGGELRKIHKLLNLDDPVDGDLVNSEEDEIREDLGCMIKRYEWHMGTRNYFLVTDEEDDEEWE